MGFGGKIAVFHEGTKGKDFTEKNHVQRYKSCEDICNSLTSYVLIWLEFKQEGIRAEREEFGRQRPHLEELHTPHKGT